MLKVIVSPCAHATGEKLLLHVTPDLPVGNVISVSRPCSIGFRAVYWLESDALGTLQTWGHCRHSFVFRLF